MTKRRRHSPNQAERDRAHGAGLPAGIRNLDRVARAVGMGPRHVRVASTTGAMAQGFEPTGTPGLYKKAHDVWALRPAEDGEGYVLVRQQEELASDLRRNASVQRTADQYDVDEAAPKSEPEQRAYDLENDPGLLDPNTKQYIQEGLGMDAAEGDTRQPDECPQCGSDVAYWVEDSESVKGTGQERELNIPEGMTHYECESCGYKDLRKEGQAMEPGDLYDAHEVMHGRDPEMGGGWMTDAVTELTGDEPDAEPDTDAVDEAADFVVGARVAFMHRGQLADAMIVFINPTHEVADLLTEGAPEEHVHDVPMNQLMAPAGGVVVMEAGSEGADPFQPSLEPASKSAQRIPDAGEWLEATRDFAPVFGGPNLVKDQIYTVDGYSTPGAENDGFYGVPKPIQPTDPSQPELYLRVRLIDEDGNTSYVSPSQIDSYTEARGTDQTTMRPSVPEWERRQQSPADIKEPTDPMLQDPMMQDQPVRGLQPETLPSERDTVPQQDPTKVQRRPPPR